VDAAPELHEVLAARLERYIVADDVTLEDVTGKEGVLHCVGFEASAPGEICATEGPGRTAVRFPETLAGFPRIAAARLGEDGWDVWVPLGQLPTIKQTLGTLVGPREDWEKRRILRGIPAWGAELDENTLPPEAGLEGTHIDYHKGCYIGQEVISRLKSVGHVNRTLRLLKSHGAELLAAGTPFFTEAGVEAGVLTSVTRLEKEGLFALGYVKRLHEAARFLSASGTPLEVVSP
jgi:folate-binding protein YgfZ